MRQTNAKQNTKKKKHIDKHRYTGKTYNRTIMHRQNKTTNATHDQRTTQPTPKTTHTQNTDQTQTKTIITTNNTHITRGHNHAQQNKLEQINTYIQLKTLNYKHRNKDNNTNKTRNHTQHKDEHYSEKKKHNITNNHKRNTTNK